MRYVILFMLLALVACGFAAGETYGNTDITTTGYIATSDSLYAAKAVIADLAVTASDFTSLTVDSLNATKIVDDSAIAFKVAIGTGNASGRYAIFVDGVTISSIALAAVDAVVLSAPIAVTTKADSLIFDVADADTTNVKGEDLMVIGKK